MFGTEKAGAGINLVRVEKVKGQDSSRPVSRQRSSAWEKQWGDPYDGPQFRESCTIVLECLVQPTQWPLQMETIYLVEIPEGNENHIRHVCDSQGAKLAR